MFGKVFQHGQENGVLAKKVQGRTYSYVTTTKILNFTTGNNDIKLVDTDYSTETVYVCNLFGGKADNVKTSLFRNRYKSYFYCQERKNLTTEGFWEEYNACFCRPFRIQYRRTCNCLTERRKSQRKGRGTHSLCKFRCREEVEPEANNQNIIFKYLSRSLLQKGCWGEQSNASPMHSLLISQLIRGYF